MEDQRCRNLLNLNDYVKKIFEDLKFLFENTSLGSMPLQMPYFDFTKKLRAKLGITFVFDRKIFLNEKYFFRYPERLAYTLFHELTHLWLYESFYDPNHTPRFYRKMRDFYGTKYPIDREVKNQEFLEKEAKLIYQCPQCHHRWHLHETLTYSMYCGPCFDRNGSYFTLAQRSREGAIRATQITISAA